MTDDKKPGIAADKNSTGGKKSTTTPDDSVAAAPGKAETEEIGGPKGLDPTRYGDWERKGILSDF